MALKKWPQTTITVNSFTPRTCDSNFKSASFKFIIQNGGLGTHCEIALRGLPQNFTNAKSKLVQVMAWCHQAASHYLSQCWPWSLSPYGFARPQWVLSTKHALSHILFWFNSLGPSDAIWRWRSLSTLVRVTACGLAAPSHYLNQCWLIISKVLWHSSEDIIIRRSEETNQ